MAKSLRSKWKRKCRAIKRERYGKKELERLRKTLGIDETQTSSSDVAMNDISDVATVVSANKIIENQKTDKNDVTGDLEVENIKKFNAKTLQNENGAYPIWLHPRKIKKVSNKSKKKKTKGKISKKK